MKTVISNPHENQQQQQPEIIENDFEVQQLRAELERLAEEHEKLLAEKPAKKENMILTEIKLSFQQTLLNAIREPSTTLAGVGVAVGIGVTHYPNIDSQAILEMLGFSSLGGMANSGRKAATSKNNQNDNFQELG